ncbi:PucR family transcriptional regulator [Microbacterium halotolerans]|uniref:PucR family transcriptional regulator n=1 Tax=Microbacterium halotolerans TaxID=246613 RepID=UPI000E6AA368|nr:PucR family transcriptional regulator [Microbacterium halotolerans]
MPTIPDVLYERMPDAIRVDDVLRWAQPHVDLVGFAVGRDRIIRWPLPTDLLDPSPFLRGGELVLTSGISILDAASQRQFVEVVSAAGAAAIGYALGVVTDTVPSALIRAANERGLAVISVPHDVPFVEIIQQFSVERHRREGESRERARVGAIVEMVRRGQASARVLVPELEDSSAAVHIVVSKGSPLPVEGSPLRGASGPYEIAIVPVGETTAGAPPLVSAEVPFGWSGPVELDRAATSIREAFAAAAVAERTGTPAGPRDLATLEGLARRLTPEQAAPFARHVIGPLRDYDARHRTRLLHTVEVACRTDGAIARATDELFVHENTLRKRAARIHALTGLNPLRGVDRAAFVIALLADAG